ncbi:Cathepsin L [Armadillidium nasatum]|uniref:Cathepsin L n=1 Tax=Armadillidium nasatum TaxID=96803 RepID=A0A5N5TCQ2_9CRUS|nr:Cathepsin L [Armadillidium nasatum]
MGNKYIVLALLVATIAASFAFPPDIQLLFQEWETYKIQYNKQYTRAEDSLRLKAFVQSKIQIAQHNQLFYEGKKSYFMGVNKFSDMFLSERIHKMGVTYKVDEIRPKGVPTFISPNKDVEIPAAIDWREKGAVTQVKDQKDCGSCWAFAAVGSLEGQHFRKTGKLVSLSEQNIVDCDTKDYGCGGGFPSDAYEYIAQNGGIDTEESYPYTAKDGPCKFNNETIGAIGIGWEETRENDEEDLRKAVATVGPISVLIYAPPAFLSYQGGVFDGSSCHYHMINHAVVVVGYGTTEDGEDYWIVKNSWGSDWGMFGYILMARNKNNACSIASYATYAIV